MLYYKKGDKMDNTLLKHMTPVGKVNKKEPKTSLEGLCVTPNYQKFKRTEGISFPLKEILENEELRSKFASDEFPEIRIMSDGAIFFKPVKYSISTTESHFDVWFALTEKGEVRHDYDYEYARLYPDSILIKCVVTDLDIKEGTFQIIYATKTDSILVKAYDGVQQITMLDNTEDNKDVIKINNDIELKVVPFDVEKYPDLQPIVANPSNFFMQYIMWMINMESSMELSRTLYKYNDDSLMCDEKCRVNTSFKTIKKEDA